MNFDAKIYVAGHTGLVGGAITNELKRLGYTNLITADYPESGPGRSVTSQIFF